MEVQIDALVPEDDLPQAQENIVPDDDLPSVEQSQDIPLVTEDLKPVRKPISDFSKQKTVEYFKSNPIFENPKTREVYYKTFEDKGFDTSELRKIGTTFDQKELGDAPSIGEGQTIQGASGQPINVETGQPIQTPESERMKNVVSAMELEASPFTAPIHSYESAIESIKKSSQAFKEDKNTLGVLQGVKGVAEGVIGGAMTGINGLLFNAAAKAAEQGGADNEAIFAPLTKIAKQFDNYEEASDEYKTLLSLGDLAVVGKALHMAGKPLSKLTDSPPTKLQVEKAKESITPQESAAILEHPDNIEAADLRSKQIALQEDQARAMAKNPDAGIIFESQINAYDNLIKEKVDQAEEQNVNEGVQKSFDHHVNEEKAGLEELLKDAHSEDGKKIVQDALDEVNDIIKKRGEQTPNTPKMEEIELAPEQIPTPDAITTGEIKQSGEPEHIGTGSQQLPTEAGNSNSIEQSGEVAQEKVAPTPEESKQFAIDFVNHDLVLSNENVTGEKAGRRKSTVQEERLDLGMSSVEKNKAIKDIKAGNYETVPAKKLIEKLSAMHQGDEFPMMRGTGGHTERFGAFTRGESETLLNNAKEDRIASQEAEQKHSELSEDDKSTLDNIIEKYTDNGEVNWAELIKDIDEGFPRTTDLIDAPKQVVNKILSLHNESKTGEQKAIDKGNLVEPQAEEPAISEPPIEPPTEEPPSSTGEINPESPGATSTKNAVVNAERLKQGLPPVEKTKVDTDAIFEQVKKHLDDPETYQSTDKNVNPHVLAKWSSEHPSEPISAWQEMLLASERDKLNNSLEAAEKAKQQAIENGDAKAVLEAEAIIENKVELLRMNDKANSYRGTQWSGIGRIRQKMIQEDYSYKGLLRKYNVVNHFEPIPKEVQADLEARGNKITELEKKLAEEQKKVGTVVRDKKIKEAATRLSDAIRKGKLSRPGVFSAATPASLVWDAALEVVAKTIDATGSVAQAVADGIAHIKGSDWYKNATDEIKKEAEDSFEDWFSDRKAREEKKVERLQKKLDDLLEGKTEETKKRTEDSPEVKALKEEIKKAKEELGLVASKPLPETPVGTETRLQKALENWKEKNETGDYETEPRIEREDTPIERRLKLQIAEERRKADRVIEARRLKDRPWYKKLADFLSEYQHLAVITSPKAIGKIASNVPMRLALHTVYDAARGTVLNLPGLRIAENAPAEFRANMKSIAKRWSTIVSADTWRDTWNTIIGKTTKADILKAKDLEDRNPNWGKGLNILRQLLYSTGVGIHKALKDPVFRAEYEASLERYNESMVNNHDITDPDIVQTTKAMAVADGLAAQFMQDNNFVSRWRQAVGDATDKQTYPGKEAVKFGAKILNPVVKLPANYAREIINLQTGLFQAMYKGAEMIADKEKRTPQEKNKLTKKILTGGAGALAISYGWNNYKNFGGYYTSSKDLENELPLGAVKIGNEVFGETVVGKVFIHFPLIAVMQIAATARRKYEDYKEKGDKNALSKGLGYGAAATFEDLPAMENLSTTGEKILHGNVQGVAQDAAKSFIPNVVNYFVKPSKEEVDKQKEDEKIKKTLQDRLDKKNQTDEQKHEHKLENKETRAKRLLHEREMRQFAKQNGIQYLPPRH
jgi:hypothetical protein